MVQQLQNTYKFYFGDKSEEEVCKNLNVDYGLVQREMENTGLPFEKVVLSLVSDKSPKKYSIYNINYDNVNDFCNQLNVAVSPVRKAILKAGDLEIGIKNYLHKYGDKITFEGKEYPTVLLCLIDRKINFVELKTFMQYESCGVLTAIEYLTSHDYVTGKVNLIRTCNSKKGYHTILEACVENNFSYEAIVAYKKNHNYTSIKEALNTRIENFEYIQKRDVEKYVINNVTYTSKAEVYRDLKLSAKTILKYMNDHKVSFEVAVEQNLDKLNVSNNKEIYYDGVHYVSISDACRKLKIPLKYVSTLINQKNYSIDEAIKLCCKQVSAENSYEKKAYNTFKSLTEKQQKLVLCLYKHNLEIKMQNSKSEKETKVVIVNSKGEPVNLGAYGIHTVRKDTVHSIINAGFYIKAPIKAKYLKNSTKFCINPTMIKNFSKYLKNNPNKQ